MWLSYLSPFLPPSLPPIFFPQIFNENLLYSKHLLNPGDLINWNPEISFLVHEEFSPGSQLCLHPWAVATLWYFSATDRSLESRLRQKEFHALTSLQGQLTPPNWRPFSYSPQAAVQGGSVAETWSHLAPKTSQSLLGLPITQLGHWQWRGHSRRHCNTVFSCYIVPSLTSV